MEWLGIEICNLFRFAFMGLSRSYDLSCKFNMLTQVIFLGPFLIDFFFNFILQYGVDWELGLIIYFDLLFLGLS
jgi:hypothetical protein